ncbi:alpha/beta hydrolase [Candidatus Woesearchaeota archaeon]|nr:alpha/beta hydrolase [Candidatus Woesearchaeota archaeon]
MKPKTEAKKLVSKDGVEITYWTTWKQGMGDEFRVLHPGAAMNHSSLARIERGLNERGYPTIIFDPRGSGYSDHPIQREYFKLDRVTADLDGILTQEGIENPTLVTHSLGFMPAVDYATKTGNATNIIGISGSHNFPETAPSKFLFQLFDKVLIYSEYVGSLGTLAAHKIRGTKRPECCNQEDLPSEFKIWLSIVDIPVRKAASHVVGQRECNLWDITPQLGKLNIPLLMIHGSKDAMVRPVAGEYIQEKTSAPYQRAVIEGGTHVLPITMPDKILEIIDTYELPRN